LKKRATGGAHRPRARERVPASRTRIYALAANH
jgi:hypothetical protein